MCMKTLMDCIKVIMFMNDNRTEHIYLYTLYDVSDVAKLLMPYVSFNHKLQLLFYTFMYISIPWFRKKNKC